MTTTEATIHGTFDVGDAVPDFELPTTTGDTVRLSQYRGSPVLVFFTTTWCPYCSAEAPYLEREIWQRSRSRGLRVLAIQVKEALSLATSFAEHHGWTFPVLVDEDGAVSEQSAPEKEGLPSEVAIINSHFVLDADGIVVHRELPEHGALRRQGHPRPRHPRRRARSTIMTPATNGPAIPPPSVRIDPAHLEPGAPAQLTVTLDIPDGCHIQSHAPREPFLIPTVLEIDAFGDVTVGPPAYPVAVVERFDWTPVEAPRVVAKGAGSDRWDGSPSLRERSMAQRRAPLDAVRGEGDEPMKTSCTGSRSAGSSAG